MMSAGAFILVGAAVFSTVTGQVLLSQFIQPPPLQQRFNFHQPLVSGPPSLVAAPSQRIVSPSSQSLAHHEVLFNAEAESQLPPHLLNPFYKNPRVAEALAKESWFGPGEMLVNERETQKIPRTRIFSVLKNAGLARRRR